MSEEMLVSPKRRVRSSPSTEEAKLYGIMAEFHEHEELLEAAKRRLSPHGCIFSVSD